MQVFWLTESILYCPSCSIPQSQFLKLLLQVQHGSTTSGQSLVFDSCFIPRSKVAISDFLSVAFPFLAKVRQLHYNIAFACICQCWFNTVGTTVPAVRSPQRLYAINRFLFWLVTDFPDLYNVISAEMKNNQLEYFSSRKV